MCVERVLEPIRLSTCGYDVCVGRRQALIMCVYVWEVGNQVHINTMCVCGKGRRETE